MYKLITIFFMVFASRLHGQQLIADTIDLISSIEVSVILKDNLKNTKLPAYCGTFAHHIVLTYNVVKVISGTYGAKTIRIDILCPRELIETKSLINGKIYRYTLKASNVQTGIHQSSGQLIYEITGEAR